MIRRWRGCLLFLLLLIAVGSGALYYLYSVTFETPGWMQGTLRQSLTRRFGGPAVFDSISVSPSAGRLVIRGLRVGERPESPALFIDRLQIECDDFAHLTAFLRDERSARIARLSDVKADASRLNEIVRKKAKERIPGEVHPVEAISGERLTLLSPVGVWTLSSLAIDIKVVSGYTTVRAQVTENPFGGRLTASATMSYTDGESAAHVIWERIRPDPIIGLCRWLYPDWPELIGEWTFNLSWRGNLEERFMAGADGWKDLLGKEVTGSVACSEGLFRWRGITATTSLVLGREVDQPWEGRLGLEMASGVARVEAGWDPLADGWGNLSVRTVCNRLEVPRGRLEEIASLPATVTPGVLSTEFDLFTNGLQTTSSGTAFATGWSYGLISSSSIAFSWSQKEDGIEATGTVEAPALRVAGSGRMSLASDTRGAFSWNGLVHDFARDNWHRLFDIDVQGRTEGEVSLSGVIDRPETWKYEAFLEVQNPYLFGLDTEHLSTRLSGVGAAWQLVDPVLSIGSGSFAELTGTIGHSGYSGKLRVEGFPLARLGVPPQEARGELSLAGQLSGSLKQPGFDGDYALENAAWQGLAFESLRGHLKWAQSKLTFAPLVAIVAGGGAVDGGFEFDLKKEHLLGLRLGFNDLPIEHLGSLMPPEVAELNPTGSVSGTVRRNVDGPDLWWEFKVGGDRVTLASETLRRFNFDGAVSSDTLEIRSLDAAFLGGQVEVHGRVDRAQADLEITAKDLEIRHSHQIQRLASPSAGIFSLQGNIEFGKRRRLGYFTLYGKDLSVRGQNLGNLGAEVAIDSSGLKIVRADLDRIGMQLDGKLGWGGGNPYQWKLQLKQTDLSFIPSSSGWLEVQPGDVIVTGTMEMSGNWAEPRPREAQARFESIEVHRGNDLVVANRPVDIRFQNEAFEIRSLELKYRNGVFGVSGIWNPHGNAALMLSGKDFSVAALARLAGVRTEVPEGRLSISGGVSGIYPDIELKGDLTVQELEFRGRKIPVLQAKCRVNPVGITVNPMTAEFPRNKITAVGSLPFVKGGLGSLDLQVEVASGPLDDLPVYLPEFFNTAKGWGKASLHFSGNPLYPQITGVARVHGDSIGFKGMKRPLTQVEVGVNTEKGLVRIEPIQAKLGRGIFSGFGEVDFREGPGSLTVKLSGQKLDVSWGRIDIERASASVDVSGNLYNPVVVGRVQIPKGKVQIADDLLGKTSLDLNLPLESLRYTVYVDIPRNLWLKNSMLNAEMRGKFKLDGDLNDWQLDGGISTVQGWLTFQRRKFTIDNGEIKFGEQDKKFDPHIYFKSVTNIQNTQVFLVLDGRLSSIKPQLYSSPPQSEGTLLAMLTLGRSMDEVMLGTGDRVSFEKEILDGLKNTYLSGLLSSTLSEAFNLDELYFDSLFDRTTGVTRSFLRIGKYIGYNVFLAYEGTLSNDGMKTYIIEYRLPRGFMLNLEVEKPRNNTRIGIKYDWKF